MILFKDFVPKQVSEPRFLSRGQYEAFEGTVARANDWITQVNANVLNVETVVLPNIHMRHEEGSTDPQLATGEGAYWHQLVRVWYRGEP